MATLKINFNSPLPNNQQASVMKNLKMLGFSVERIFQDGQYIQFRYYGRLPTFDDDDCKTDLLITDNDTRTYLISNKFDFVEFYLLFERKNTYEN